MSQNVNNNEYSWDLKKLVSSIDELSIDIVHRYILLILLSYTNFDHLELNELMKRILLDTLYQLRIGPYK